MTSFTRTVLLGTCLLLPILGCGDSSGGVAAPTPAKAWLGIPSAVNHVITFLHDSTGWLLNKSDVSIKLQGEVRELEGAGEFVGDFRIAVKLGEEAFETTGTDVPCDDFGIPTEESVKRLREAVEEIKVKMKQLQN